MLVNALKSADAYHHGDLRNALADAATTLAREGGPDAVVLREAARRVGVTPAAAYHHFANREQLVQAVKHRALTLLTDRMRSALDEDQADQARGRGERPGAADTARRRLRALGAAYLGFAFDEPGLFRLAFQSRGPWPTDGSSPPHYGSSGPFNLLHQVLDELAAAGVIPAERRPRFEYVVWALVHGIAALCLDGPLGRINTAERADITENGLDILIRGL